MTTDEILGLMRLAGRSQSNWQEGDWFAEHYIRAMLRQNGCETEREDSPFIAACDPTTIAALCRANLRLVAMETFIAEAGPRITWCTFERLHKRTAEILASMEKGNG